MSAPEAARVSTVGITALPDELWERIARLARPADLPALSRTCRRGRRAFDAVVATRRRLFDAPSYRPRPSSTSSCAEAEAASCGLAGGGSCTDGGGSDERRQCDANSDGVADNVLAEAECVSLGVRMRLHGMAGCNSPAAMSPRAGRWVVVIHVRCCAQCNEGMKFVAGAPIEARAELWDTSSGMRVDMLPFDILSPGEQMQQVELRWTRFDTLAVVVGETNGGNDALQVHSFMIEQDGKGRLTRMSSVYVGNVRPHIDLFHEDEPLVLDGDATDPMLQLVHVRRDIYGDDNKLGKMANGTEEASWEWQLDEDLAHQSQGIHVNPEERVVFHENVEINVPDENYDLWGELGSSAVSSPISASPTSLSSREQAQIALPLPPRSLSSPPRRSRTRSAGKLGNPDGIVGSRSTTVVVNERVCILEPLCLQTSMDGHILLVSDAGSDYVQTYNVDALSSDECTSSINDTRLQKSPPLATFPARRNNSFCFLSPCGTYVAVVSSVFASEDFQEGYTEKLTIAMHRADGSSEMYRVTFEMSVTGDFRPGQQSAAIAGRPTRGDYAQSSFNDGSESVCDTFAVPMADNELPVVMVVETGEVLCLPPLSGRTVESIANRPDVPLYRYSLNEDLFITFFSTQSGSENCGVQVYDCVAKQKLIATLRTPKNHRWQCEAHSSGYVYIENNCGCCSSLVLLPVDENQPLLDAAAVSTTA